MVERWHRRARVLRSLGQLADTISALRQCAENSRQRRYVTWQRSRLDLFTASRVLQKPNFAVLARV